MSRYVIYYKYPDPDRWIKNDHIWRSWLRRVVRGPRRVSGVELVFLNLVKGLEKIGANFVTNIPFSEIEPDDRVGVVGVGRNCLEGYCKPNPIVAGVAVIEHPTQWLTMFEETQVACCVVHSDWVQDVFERYYGPRIERWAAGIDTDLWSSPDASEKNVDFLIYDKIRWSHEELNHSFIRPIMDELRKRSLSFEVIRYGHYRPRDLKAALDRCRAMIFLCEHESQGFACQQAMACGVPILAWDQGTCLDPNRFGWGDTTIPATSVPYFDARSGLKFTSLRDFPERLDIFLDGLSCYDPRSLVLEELSLEVSARRYVDILDKANA